MDIKRTNLSDTSVELIITASEERLKELKTHTLEKLQPEIEAPGFRKGKVPLNVVEKQVKDEHLQAQFIDEALGHIYGDAVSQEKLRVLEQPKIEMMSFVPYSELTFKATVTVVPAVKLGDYKKLKKKLPTVKVDAKEIDDVIENLRTRSAEKKAVKRAAADTDEVVIDFHGKDAEGEDVAGASGKDYPIVIGSETFIPGFEPELVGLKTGEKKEFTITFPKDYGHKPLAGRDVTFAIEVKDVKEVVLPKADDDFAKKLGPFTSLDGVREDIEKELTQQKNNEELNKLKDELVGDLVEKSEIVVPDILLDDQMKLIQQDFTQNLTYRGITMTEYLEQNNQTEEDFMEKDLKPKALKRVQAGLVLAEVADAEKLDVSPEEIDIRLQLMKGQNPSQAEQLDAPQARQDIASRMLTEKTVDLLVDIATKK